MNKQEALEKVYSSALEDELSKIGMVNPAILKQYSSPSRVKALLNVLERAAGKSKEYASVVGKKGKSYAKKAWTPFEANEEAIWRAGKRRDFIGKGNSSAEKAKRNKLRNLLVRSGIIGTPIAATAGAVIPTSIASHRKKNK